MVNNATTSRLESNEFAFCQPLYNLPATMYLFRFLVNILIAAQFVVQNEGLNVWYTSYFAEVVFTSATIGNKRSGG